MSERFKQLVFVRYLDHVLYNRACAEVIEPQIRQAVGWLVCENNLSITIAWDSDAQPPTLRGGDAKASGLVLLKSTILGMEKVSLEDSPLQKSSEWHLNSQETTVKVEYALQPMERKNSTKAKRDGKLTAQTTQSISRQPITRASQLTLNDLKSLNLPIDVQGETIIIEHSLKGWKLQQPVILNLNKVLAAKEKGLITYILTAFLSERPPLIPFVFDNQSLLKMARHFLRHCSGSYHSCLTYTVNVQKYSTWLGFSPDTIIQDLKPVGSIPDPQRVQNHQGYLNDYLAELQDDGLKPGAVNNYIKAVKTFYRVNGVKIELTEPLSRRITYKDRAPKPEELTKLLDIADLRGRVIITCFALGAFREETLSKLKYRHVKDDIESNVTPVHIHVEAEITKGKYHDYDTFLGAEATQYLKLYFEQRRKGTNKLPPEELTDESPIIRDEMRRTPKSITPKQLRKLVHNLYLKAGLIKQQKIRMYDLRTHSLRKYFKTQLLALGVQPDYVDYMMGHTVDTYHDIQSIGIDTLRNVYASSGLGIRRKTQNSKIDALKEIIRAWGMNPEQYLTRDALAEGATTHRSPQDLENHQLVILSEQLRSIIRREAAV